MDKCAEGKIPCKYGENCYQKNPDHHKKFSHPPRKRPIVKECSNSLKKAKLNDIRNESPSESSAAEEKVSENESTLAEKKYSKINSDLVQKNSCSGLIIMKELSEDTPTKMKMLFLVDMPDDFYEFYEFCKSFTSKSPKNALKALDMELVGPFDVFNELLKNCSKDDILRHSRYYYDPPEFQTVLKGNDKSLLHYGYFRDNPNEAPSFVAENKAAEGPIIHCVAGNLFGAVNVHASKMKALADPFRKMQIHKLQTSLVKWAEKKNYSLDTVTSKIKCRRSKVVAKTFNKIGIVVPYDKKTDVGYRPLAMKDDELEKLLKKLIKATTDLERDTIWSKLENVITFANIANDEGDFGTSLELGLDMFAVGGEVLHKTIEQLLGTTYTLLQRNQFGDILKAHLKCRSMGSNLNTIV